MMTTSENATQKSITRPHLSVHHIRFLCALCHELVRSMIQRFVAPSGAGLPLSAITPLRARASSFSRVAFESAKPGGVLTG
jgi:hypothetical protein